MKKLTFEYRQERNLDVVLDRQEWWFSLENLAVILGVNKKDFVRKSRSSRCRTIDETTFSNLQEFCHRLFASRQPWAKEVQNWFFDEVFPQLRSFEIEDPLTPITTRLEKLESKYQEINSNIDGWGEMLSQMLSEKLTTITQAIATHQQSLANPEKSHSPAITYLSQLREQQRFNNQIVENFIRSLETIDSPLSNAAIAPFDYDPITELVDCSKVVANGSNGKGNGWQGNTRND